MDYLDTPLMTFGQSHWTIRNAVEGVQIFGGIGSGKTSGSGRTLALKYLAAGFGGLVLTVKPEEREMWEEYCRLTGRLKDLIIVAPPKPNPEKPDEVPEPLYRFNFLEYESRKRDGHVSATTNIAAVLKTVIQADEEKTSGRTNDPFWRDALDMLMATVIDLCMLAYNKVTVKMMYEIAQTLPTKEGYLSGSAFALAYKEADKKVTELRNAWELTLPSTELPRVFASEAARDNAAADALPDARRLRMIDQFIKSLINLGEKTRSTIEFSFTGFLYNLMRDPVYSLFCEHESNFTPEDCRKGKIILIDLPVKLYHKAGRDSQILFKYIWQRAMERGNADKPAFLWADEAQNFLHPHDPDFQATARSSRIATVYLSQNMPNYNANMGGDNAQFKVKSFLGTLSTKIFHANADIETNKYASDLIGEAFYNNVSATFSHSLGGSNSATDTLKLEKLVRPEEFGQLRSGGDGHKKAVDAYIHFQSKVLEKKNHLKIEFNQEYKPS